MIKLHAEASALTVTEGLDDTAVVSGMANVASVQVTFSEEWDGLDKVLVFTDGVRTIIHELTQDDEIVPIPHVLMAEPGRTIYIGVQGTDGERVILPTVMCRLKAVAWGADPDGDTTTVPSKVHWVEVRDELERLAGEAAASESAAAASAEAAAGSASDAAHWEGLAQGIVEPVVTGAIATWLSDNPTALSDAVVLGKLSSYDTVSAMRSDAYLQIGQVVATLGYTSKGDGGGCLYYISASEVQDAVNIAVGNKYAVMIMPSTVTPEMFGAVGNGTAGTPHDDTAAVQAAVSSGKIVKFQPKTYYLGSGKITIEHDCTIYGNGATLLLNPVLVWSGSTRSNNNVVYAHDCNLTMYDITLDANSLNRHKHNGNDDTVNALSVENCITKCYNVSVDKANYHNIYVKGGEFTFTNGSLHENGDYAYDQGGTTGVAPAITTNSFIYSDNNAITKWENISIERAVFGRGGQGFYMKNGNHTIVGYRTKNVTQAFDARNGYFNVSKGYFENSGGFIAITYPQASSEPEKNGADIIATDLVYNGVAALTTDYAVMLFNCCKSCVMNNIHMILSASLQTNYGTELQRLIRFYPAQYQRYIDYVNITNLVIEGDGICENYMVFHAVKNVTYDNVLHHMRIELHNIEFPAPAAGSYVNLGNVYECDGTATIIVDNVNVKGVTGDRATRFWNYSSNPQAPFQFYTTANLPESPANSGEYALKFTNTSTGRNCAWEVIPPVTTMYHTSSIDPRQEAANSVVNFYLTALSTSDPTVVWKSAGSAQGWIIDVPVGATKFQVVTGGSTNYIAFLDTILASDPTATQPTANGVPGYCTGTGKKTLPVGFSDLTIPSDCHYIYIYTRTTNGTDITPINLRFEIDEGVSGSPIVLQMPEAPASDGTYTLKATVRSGTVTYSWDPLYN